MNAARPLQLLCLGTGTAAPERDRACSGYWVEAGDLRLLLDCGPGVVHSMARLAVEWHTLTHLALSHFHNDHTGDVPFLFFALHYGLAAPRTAPLPVIGPKGTRKLFERLGSAFGNHLRRPRFPVTFHELDDGDTLQLARLTLTAFATPHTAASLAYRLEQDGRVIGYTGDTGESEALADFMAGADVLLAECSLPEPDALPSHLTPERLARMAVRSKPGLLVATHVYPRLDRAALPGLIRAAGWAGATRVAEDGLRLP